MKKYISGIVAVAIAVCLSAFTVQHNNKNAKDATYYFIGTAGQEFNANEYSTSSLDLPTPCNSGTDLTCQFTVPSPYPDITSYMQYLNSLTQAQKEAEYNSEVVSHRKKQ